MRLDEQINEYFKEEDRKYFKALQEATIKGFTQNNSIKEFAKDLFDVYTTIGDPYTKDPGGTWRHAVAKATSYRIDHDDYIRKCIGDCPCAIYDIVREGVDAAMDEDMWRVK